MTTKRKIATAAAALLAGVFLLGTAAPARADDDDHGHRRWREHEWREHHEWRPYYYGQPSVVVAPPPAVYAPPAVVYAPPPPVVYAPPPAPSVNFVFPLRFN